MNEMDSGMQTTDKIELQEAVWDVIYLTACALHEQCPDRERTARMDFSKVYRMSKFHGMEALVFMALEGTEELSSMGEPLAREWKEAKEKAIRKNMLLDAGRSQLLGEMELAGIWYMPLKGSILQTLYPKYGMRQMSDNDILYDSGRRGDVIAMMKRWGYVSEDAGSCSYHDGFVKPPVYNFEMHTSLFDKKENPVWYQYYENIKDRLLRNDDVQYGYHFTDEDFYVYMIAHAYVHYSHNGCGLRTLADSYIYIWKMGNSLDWNDIQEQVSELGISDFEKKLRLLSEKLLGENALQRKVDLDEEELESLLFFADSGTYGTLENFVARQMRQYGMEGENLTFAGRLRYLWNRLFPSMEWFRKNEPFYARHKLLIPFFLVYRALRYFVSCRKLLGKELRILWNADSEFSSKKD